MLIAFFCFVRIFCILYICMKFLKKDICRKYTTISYAVHMSVLFIISFLIQKHFLSHTTLAFILLTTICLLNLYNLKFSLALSLSLISYATYYIAYIIASLLPALAGSIYYYYYNEFPYTLIVLATGILTILLLHLLLNSKRINYGISLFRNRKFTNTFTILSIAILISKAFDYNYTNNKLFKYGISKGLIISLATFLLAILLFTWWRKQITRSYIEKLRKLEVQSLYDELEEKERLIQKLTADNESLSRIIHKDNKLIPAMEHAVMDFLSGGDFQDMNAMKQYGQELTAKLQAMAQDRKGILESYENESHKLRLTGHISLDAILVYMQKKADANHISFECKHSPESVNYLLSKISEDDLTHLLSDLIENAIIAMKEQENGRLLVTFGKLQKEAYISISDTGTDFDITTLHSLGLRPHTTHVDSGGSGIGLMDIWKIKRKYRATIHIQEFRKENENFTKRILFSFNKKNHYVIQSYRHMDIINTQTRGDLYVIPTDEKETNGGKIA